MTSQITIPRETWDAVLEALIGCIEHMEYSTPQGKSAYQAAIDALQENTALDQQIDDSELSGMWSYSDFTGGSIP